MLTVLLVVHVLVTIALIAIVLVQKSEGGALGIGGGGGGGGGGMGGFMTGREAANLLTRTTAVLATLFMSLSLAIAIVTGSNKETGSILDSAPVPVQSAPAAAAPAEPEKPAAPTAPIAE